MRKKWKKIGIFLGMIAIMNTILKPSTVVFTIQAEDIQDNILSSYQSIGNITIEKQNLNFKQEINNGEFVLWNWKQNKKQYTLDDIKVIKNNQLEQLDSAIPNISDNNRVASITVTKEKDIMYILLSENKEKKSMIESYQLLKYQLKQTEKIVKTIAADYKEYSSAQELVTNADWIFTGTVKNITYENSYASFLNVSQCTFNLDTETENTVNGITYSEILKLIDK